jgi:fluoroacetyl-CoA thioesterase
MKAAWQMRERLMSRNRGARQFKSLGIAFACCRSVQPARGRTRYEVKSWVRLTSVTVGMAAEKKVTITPEMTVGHVVPGMPPVCGTPMMILHMEMPAGSAIQPSLPAGHVSVGMMVNIRHLAATPAGRTVRAIARVVRLEDKSILFEVEAWDGGRKIGDGTHRRGLVNVAEFEKRFGVTTAEDTMA